MSLIEKTATKSALEQIEKEIQQIDQLVNSWSDGRSLRFDPAHVRSAREEVQEQPVQRPARTLKPNKLVFLFNILAFCFPVAFVAIQASTELLTIQMSMFVLTTALMLVAGGNLFLAGMSMASAKKKNRSHRQIKNGRNQKSASVR